MKKYLDITKTRYSEQFLTASLGTSLYLGSTLTINIVRTEHSLTFLLEFAQPADKSYLTDNQVI